MPESTLLFAFFILVAMVSSIIMLTCTNPLDGAVCLVICFLSFAAMYALMNAPFVAIMQVLVYAGAIMMLIVFVIMTIDSTISDKKISLLKIIQAFLAIILVLTCITLLGRALIAPVLSPVAAPVSSALKGTVANIGTLLFSRHLLIFELISLLLLSALVGAILFGKHTFKTSFRPDGPS